MKKILITIVMIAGGLLLTNCQEGDESKDLEKRVANQERLSKTYTKKESKLSDTEYDLTSVCRKGRDTVMYSAKQGRVYHPGLRRNVLCVLDVSTTRTNPDWWADNRSSYCYNKLQELVRLRVSSGYTCN